MGKVLLVEDNTNAVKKIVRYIDNISADLEVHSVSEAGEIHFLVVITTVSKIFFEKFITENIAYF